VSDSNNFLFLSQVAAVSGNKELAELINNFSEKDIGTKTISECIWPPLFLFVYIA